MKINYPSRLVVLLASLLIGPLAAETQTDIPLKKLTAPDNAISDGDYGVSMTYPAGWTVERGYRWGQNRDKTSIVLQGPKPAAAKVGLFYQKYGGETRRPQDIKAWFLNSFHEKQAERQGLPDYQSDLASLSYGTTAGGLPRCSWQATYTKGPRSMVEYYVRLAGEKTFFMFIALGTPSEIKALRAEIDQMADTVRLP